MKTCPYCAETIQENAIKCRYCGEFLDGRARPFSQLGYFGGYEYRSEAELFGLPLVHIAQGIDPQTGMPRVAKGIIAIGNLAIGVIAMGGVALGGLTVGGLSLGLLAFGGVAIGGVTLGGLAVGAVFAAGGMAISALYALGGLALAPHAVGATGTDPEFLRMLERLFLSR